MRHPYLTMEWWRIQGELWRIATRAAWSILRADPDEFEYLAETVAGPVRQRREAVRDRWANR